MCFFLCRTLPAKHLEEIANQFRIHNINALLVIGGFEVRPSIFLNVVLFIFLIKL